MRFVKIILAGLLVVVSLFAGLAVAAVAVAVGVVAYIVLRLKGKKGNPVTFSGSFSTSRSKPPQRAARTNGDAIDIEASEIPAEPAARLPEAQK